MFIRIKEVANLLQEISPDQTIILSHADHDGFASSALVNSYFDAVHDQRAEITYPSRDKSYWIIFREILSKKPKYLLIMDVVIGRHKHELQQITDAGTTIVDMDHHDLMKFSHKSYIDINPHNWGIEYLNSSGYLNGILGFRALFYDYDVRKIANLFGGGGPHPKVGGAETRKGFKGTVTQIHSYLQREKYQKQLYEWLPRKD